MTAASAAGLPAFDVIPRRAWLVLAFVSMASVQNPLSQSILNIAFPKLLEAFPDVSAATMSWVVSAYAITAAATLIVGGVFVERYGAKRMIVFGSIGFCVASIVCGFANNIAMLIISRIVQALFGSLLTPAGAALVISEFPPSRRATAIAGWAASGSVATAIGPTLGALLIDAGGWRWTFWVSPFFAAIGLIALPRLVEELPVERKPFPDLLSIPLVMVFASGVVLGISQSGRWGWSDWKTVGSIVAGLVFGVLLLWRSSRNARPLLDLSLMRFRSLRLANIASLTFGASFFALFFGFPRFTQEVWKFDIRAAGLLFLPIPVAGMFLNGYAGRYADLRGYRAVMVLGGVLQVAGAIFLLLFVGGERNVPVWIAGLTLVGLGGALSWPAIFGNTVRDVPREALAAATSINQTAQRMATAMGTAIATAVIGEQVVAGQVGTFSRVFWVCLLGGALGVVIGLRMDGRART